MKWNYKDLSRLPGKRALQITALLTVLFFVFGLLGLQTQAAQTGVSLIWPASGLVLAFFVFFGLRVWPGVLLGMLGLAHWAGVPLWVGFIIGLGAIAESAIPLVLVARYGFNGRLNTLNDVMLFLAVVTIGPIFSASAGAAAMYTMSVGMEVPSSEVFLLWWLGNSFGMLIIGGLLLVARECYTEGYSLKRPFELLLVIVASMVLSIVAFRDLNGLQSLLTIHLLIPMVVVATIRLQLLGVLLPILVATLVLIGFSNGESLQPSDGGPLGIVYLDIAELWFIAFTGLIVGSAYQDREVHGRMAWLAQHDTLTRLMNRLGLEYKIVQALEGDRRGDRGLHLLFIDLDQMKYVNDHAGHQAGDMLLQSIGKLLKKQVRASDSLGRWGGDEFIVLLNNCNGGEARDVAEKVCEAVRQMDFSWEGDRYATTVSIGVASAREGDEIKTLIARADMASYLAKEAGRDQMVYAEQSTDYQLEPSLDMD